MGRFAQKHPGQLTKLVAEAIAKGAKAPQVQRELAAGTFPGWDSPYEMPLETIRYYGKKEKERRAANALSPLAKGDPSRGIDHLARQLFAEAEIGIEDMRRSKDRDPEALKKWGDALKVIGSLLRPEEHQPTKTGKKTKTPSDPLTASLAAAAAQQETVPPHTPAETDTNGTENSGTTPNGTNTQTQTAAGLLHGSAGSAPWLAAGQAA